MYIIERRALNERTERRKEERSRWSKGKVGGGAPKKRVRGCSRQCYDNLFLGYKLFTRSTPCNPSCFVKLVQVLSSIDGIITKHTFFFVALEGRLFTKPLRGRDKPSDRVKRFAWIPVLEIRLRVANKFTCNLDTSFRTVTRPATIYIVLQFFHRSRCLLRRPIIHRSALNFLLCIT